MSISFSDVLIANGGMHMTTPSTTISIRLTLVDVQSTVGVNTWA